MWRFLIASGVLAIWVPLLASQNTPARAVAVAYADPNAYAIYAVLLKGEHGRMFVIQTETGYDPKMKVDGLGISGDASFRKEWGTTLSDCANQYHVKRYLTHEIPINVPYELVSEKKVTTLLQPPMSWDRFDARFPEAHGVYSFSAVGFDKQRTHAIVEMSNSCGSLCGRSGPRFLEKKDGKWQEVSVTAKFFELMS